MRKLFDSIAPRFKDRPGGYTRIIKVGMRRGDAAPISVIELVASPDNLPQTPHGRRKRRGVEDQRKEPGAVGKTAQEPTA